MLVDVLNNDSGYVRVFAEEDGYGYDVATYGVLPIPDLFQRMTGYRSLDSAQEAAKSQLAAIEQRARRLRGRARKQ